MWNHPSKDDLAKIPALYSVATPLKQTLIHMHFFIGGCDWYASEFDGEDIFFGFAILNNDLDNAEWGYFSLRELSQATIRAEAHAANGQGKIGFPVEVDRDLHWVVRPAIEVENIKKSQGW